MSTESASRPPPPESSVRATGREHARLARIQHLFSTQRWDEVIQLAQEGLQDDPHSAMLLAVLATGFYYQGRYDDAVQSAQAALAADPVLPGALDVLAHSLLATGHNAEAFDVSNHFIVVAPHLGDSYHTRAYIRWQSDDGSRRRPRTPRGASSEAALDDIDVALSLDPSSTRFLALRAEILSSMNRRHDSEVVWKRILEIDPNNAPAHVALANLRFNEQRITESHEHLVAGLQADAHSPQAQEQYTIVIARRLAIPVWVASWTGPLILLAALVFGRPSTATSVVAVAGVIATLAFAIGWWRRLNTSDRRVLTTSPGRRALILAAFVMAFLVSVGPLVAFVPPGVDAIAGVDHSRRREDLDKTVTPTTEAQRGRPDEPPLPLSTNELPTHELPANEKTRQPRRDGPELYIFLATLFALAGLGFWLVSQLGRLTTSLRRRWARRDG